MSLTTVVTKSVSQNGIAFSSSQQNISGQQTPPLDTSVTVGSPLVVVDGIGTLKYANLQLLYMLSDNLDCTVGFYTGTDGATGLIGSPITILAGQAYEWDSATSGANPLGTSNCGSIKITATNYIDGVASGGTPTVTNVHCRTSLSA